MSEDVETLLHDLELRIDRLKVLYEQYFIGMEKAEPMVPRKEVLRTFAALQQIQIRNTALRFRYNSLNQRWQTYTTKWGKTLREIELGTYDRHVARAQRRGIELPLEVAGKARVPPPVPHEVEEERFADPQDLLDEGDLSEMVSEIDDGARFGFEGADPLGLDAAATGIDQGRGRSITPPPAPPSSREPPPRERSITPPPFSVAPVPRGLPYRERERSITPPPISVGPEPRGLPYRGTAPPPLPPPAARAEAAGPPPRERDRSLTPPPIFVGPEPRGTKLPSRPEPPSPIPGMSEPELRALHRRYVDARKSSGGGEVRYESLVATLQKQVPELLAKHKVARVSFDVAVKEGKVILKATPKRQDPR